MTVQSILAPVFAQVLLTFGLLFWMARERFATARSGPPKGAARNPRTAEWTGRARQVSDCFHNQLETPLLFYVVVTLALVTKLADLLFVLLAWLFVVTRYAHAVEHCGPNRLKFRFGAFAAGVVILLCMWTELALKVFLAI